MFGASFVLLTSRHFRLPGLFLKIEWYLSKHECFRRHRCVSARLSYSVAHI